MIEEYKLRDKNGKKLTEKLQIDQIDMEKAKEICYCNNEREEKIRKWCLALNARTSKELRNYLGELMSKEDSEKLVEKIEEMSVEEQYADIYIEAELHTPIQDMIRNTEMLEAKEEARKEGRKEGLEQGIEQGSNARNIEIAKIMLSLNTDLEYISKVTGLTLEEISVIEKDKI